MTLQNKIRLCRILKGFSIENMAMELGVDKSSYSRLERGNTKLDASKLLTISKILEVELDWLLSVQEISLISLVRQAQLIQNLKQENEQLKAELALCKRSGFILKE